MPLIDIEWLGQHANVPKDLSAAQLAEALVKVGIEEEAIHSSGVIGPVVIGWVISAVKEPQNNGKTISWCIVDVGEDEPHGIVCGAPNVKADQKVVVALPGAILPGDFAISARKTYGHISDGMICSEKELGMGDSHDGIIDLKDFKGGADFEVGANAIEILGLGSEVLEVNITPNRGDCFSYRGIGREFSISTGTKFIDKAAAILPKVPKPSKDAFEVKVDDQNPLNGKLGCTRFASRIVKNVDASKQSPEWMQTFLKNSGMRPISAIVDISNYIMLDLGQPMHCYDLDKVAEPIVVRRAKGGESLKTLDGQDRKLDADDLLITDSNGKRIIGLAGVMGGLDSEISDSTKNVLIEAANFDAISMARSARLHKLPSEASKRNERGVDDDLPAIAAQMAVDLLVEFAGGEADGRVGDLDLRVKRADVQFDIDSVKRVTGLDASKAQIKKILEQIGCEILGESKNVLKLASPHWRNDLEIDEDFCEEVARIIGYDALAGKLPTPAFKEDSSPGLSANAKIVRNISNALSYNGYSEVKTYPFIGKAEMENLLIDAASNESNLDLAVMVKLANPLDVKSPYLRTSVLSTLISAAQRNVSRGNDSFAIYEVGVQFTGNDSNIGVPDSKGGFLPDADFLEKLNFGLPNQILKIAGILHGDFESKSPLQGEVKVDFKAASSVVGILSQALNKRIFIESARGEAPLDPNAFGIIRTDNKPIGVIGELHPNVCQNFGLAQHSLAFEINLNGLFLDPNPKFWPAKAISKYPALKQDFSFTAPESFEALAIQNAITRILGDELEEISLVDIYRGSQIPEGQKSVTFKLKIRSAQETLKPNQILELRDQIINHLNLPGVKLRD